MIKAFAKGRILGENIEKNNRKYDWSKTHTESKACNWGT